jgi:hypothetical protein
MVQKGLEKILGDSRLENEIDGVMKGQLLEELLGTRMQSKGAREAAAGTKAVAAAAKAKSEIESIPGHLIRDAENAMLTDGVLAYREGGRWHVVSILESKAGQAPAQKLKRAWKDIPRPATTAEKQRWIMLTPKQVEQLGKTDRGLSRNIQRWKEVRMEAVEELRETRPPLAKRSSAFIEKNHAAELDELMEALPKSESGQARKSIERLVPSHGKASMEIQIGVQNTDGSVRWEAGAVTGGTQTTKLVGVVPSNVQGRNLKKIAEAEKMAFELMNDLGVTELELLKAAEALAAASK